MLRCTTMTLDSRGARRRLRVLHRLTTASSRSRGCRLAHTSSVLPARPLPCTHHTNQHTSRFKENPMLSTHPYVAEQLIRDRQERLRQISQQTHLRQEARRISDNIA